MSVIHNKKIKLIQNKESPIKDTQIENYLSNKKLNLEATTNKNLAISTLCLVGLNPEDLNFFKMSIFFTF